MELKFSKYHGAGNDFVMIDNRDGVFGEPTVEKIKKICDRHKGIGADGIILLNDSEGIDFKMRYFNADLGDETMCGNGTRCIVAFARELGIIQNQARFLAHDGAHEADVLPDGNIAVKMADVAFPQKHGEGFVCDTGCPHYVEVRKDIENLDLIPFAQEIRYSQDFPNGVNVNVIEMKEGAIPMRTYERGVEDETLACGTGAVAVAVTLAKDAPDGQETEYVLDAKGGTLKIKLTKKDDHFENVWLIGPAEKAFEGIVSL